MITLRKSILTWVLIITTVCGSCLPRISVSAASANEKTIYNYLINAGFNTAAAVGILANIEAESNFNPNAKGDYTNGTATSYGICQWHNDRWTNLKKYRPNDWQTLNGQLAFLVHELAVSKRTINSYMRNSIPNTDDGAYEAGRYWCYNFEVPANRTSVSKTRGNRARNYFWPRYITIPDFEIDSRYPTPFTAYPLATSGKVTVYSTSLAPYSQTEHYIAYNDLCKVTEVYTNGYCEVNYPTSSGSTSNLAKLSDFMMDEGVTPYSYSPSSNANTYTRSDMSVGFGSVFSTDRCTVVSRSGNKLQLIYPLSGGGYKLGWIYSTVAPVPITSDLKTPLLGYNASANDRTDVYEFESTIGGERYGQVFVDDLCTINSVNIEKDWAYITYPVSGGTKSGYVYLNKFFPYLDDKGSVYTTKVSSDTKVYRKSDMVETVGDVYSTDTIYVLGKAGNKVQIEYPVTVGTNAGKYKLGWITSDKIAKTLKYITVTSNPSKTVYLEGEPLNTNGLAITAYYDDGSSANVTGSCTFSGYSNTPGVKTVTAAYSGQKASFTVTVNQKSPVSLSIMQMPVKTTYKAGEEFDPTGLKVTAKYDNNTTADVTTEVLLFGTDEMFEAGTKMVSVEYVYNSKVVEAEFSVTVEKAADGFKILQQPENVQAIASDIVTLKVTAIGTDLSYQWQWSSNGSTWKNCTSSGYDTDTFSFAMKETLDGRLYRCIVMNGSKALLSESALITLIVPDLIIIKQPQDVEAQAGEKVVLSVCAEGDDLNYQWQWSRDGKTWKDCTSAGSNTDTFCFAMKETLSGRMYRCVVSDRNKTTVSGEAEIRLKEEKLAIVIQPEDVEATAGEKVSVSVKTTGRNLNYQWQWSREGKTWKNCSTAGYNTDTFCFTMKTTLAGRLYRCIIDDENRGVISESALISLADETLKITEQPENYIVAVGERVNLLVRASGKGLNYQWQWKASGTAWKNCTAAGHNTALFSFQMKASYDGRLYRCMIFDEEGNAVISETAAIELVKRASIDIIGGEAEAEPEIPEEKGDAAEETADLITEEEETSEGSTGYDEAEDETIVVSDAEGKVEAEHAEAAEPEEEQEAESEEHEEAIDINVISKPFIVNREEDTATVALEAEGEGLSYIWQYSSDTDPEWREIQEGIEQGIFIDAEGEESDKLTIRLAETDDKVKARCVISDLTGTVMVTEEVDLRIR